MKNEMTEEMIEAARVAYCATHPDLGKAVAAWSAHKRKMAAILAASGKKAVTNK